MHESLKQDQLYVTVDLLILAVKERKLRLLLSRRTDPPCAGQWALPGRFIGTEESAEEAVRRLLEEMFPVREAYSEQLYTFSEVERDPRGRVISAAYLVIVPERRMDEVLRETETSLVPFAVTEENGLRLRGADGTELSGAELAFDHGRIIETGVLRLRGKVDYTDIGFRFLNDPGAFSLGELQTVFEAVLGRSVDSSNFRRFIRNRYEDTGRITPTEREEKQKRGRPAILYELKGQGGNQS